MTINQYLKGPHPNIEEPQTHMMNLFLAADILSEKITEKYGFRPGKSFSLVLQSAWWHGLGDKSSIDPKEIEDIAQSIFQQIDRGEID